MPSEMPSVAAAPISRTSLTREIREMLRGSLPRGTPMTLSWELQQTSILRVVQVGSGTDGGQVHVELAELVGGHPRRQQPGRGPSFGGIEVGREEIDQAFNGRVRESPLPFIEKTDPR